MATLNSYEGLLPPQSLNQAEQAVMAGPPAVPTPLPEIIAALRTVTQLDGLTDEHHHRGPPAPHCYRKTQVSTRIVYSSPTGSHVGM